MYHELKSQLGPVMTEEQIVGRATLDDLDKEFFRRNLPRQGCGLRRVGQPDIVSECRNFGVITHQEDRPVPTPFGMLAFGREPQPFPRMRFLAVRDTAYNGTGRSSEVLLAGEGNGRLDAQVNRTPHRARAFGWREIPVPGVPRRTDRPVLPLDALREAVVNTVVHRDYPTAGSPTPVAVFPDRVEITNPGTLPNGMTPAVVRRGRITRTRNGAIAHYAVSANIMEQRGMGWSAIEDAVQDFNGATPRIEKDRETAWMRVTLDLPPPEADRNG